MAVREAEGLCGGTETLRRGWGGGQGPRERGAETARWDRGNRDPGRRYDMVSKLERWGEQRPWVSGVWAPGGVMLTNPL